MFKTVKSLYTATRLKVAKRVIQPVPKTQNSKQLRMTKQTKYGGDKHAFMQYNSLENGCGCVMGVLV